MSNPTRKELWDRIRTSSKDEVILEEMIRLGFWPRDGELPNDPAVDIKRIGDLQRALQGVYRQQGALLNVDSLKKLAHKQRLADARARREETKARRAQQRKDRAAAWALRKQSEILHLGDDVSNVLGKRDSDVAKLQASGLPVLREASDVAGMLGVDVPELRWLAYSRRVSSQSHYKRFTIPKKTGGERHISAPMPRLKAAQNGVYHSILGKVRLHDAAHGFVPGRSIVTNATPHVGQAVVVNMDLRNFFPTLTFKRVAGMFRTLGYSPEVSTILGLLCTEPVVQQVELDGAVWQVQRGERVLPQGSPASPAITNVICWRLDRRLHGLAHSLGFTYTRYADDLTFSASTHDAKVGTLLRAVGTIVEDSGFVVHPDKTRVMRRGARQEVTGLVVNDKIAVPRRHRDRFRAVLFQVERDGPQGKQFGQAHDVMDGLLGFANFVRMVDPGRGQALVERVQAVAASHGWQRKHKPRTPATEPSWERKKREAAEALAAAEAEQRAALRASADKTVSTKAKSTKSGKGGPKGSDPGASGSSRTSPRGAATGEVNYTRTGGDDDPADTVEDPVTYITGGKKKWFQFWRKA